MPIRSLLERNAYLLAIILTISVAILSLISVSNVSVIEFKNSDKLAHTFTYFILALSWLYATKNQLASLKKKLLLIVGLIIYGIIIEVLQGVLTTYRTADFYDILANSLGILLAVFFFKKLNSWLNSMLK